MNIEKIRDLVRKGRYQYSNHAKEMMFERAISEASVVNTVFKGEVLEEYTQDARGRSYLLLTNEPLHVVIGYNEYKGKAVIITTYIPEPPKWLTSNKRGR